jgi:hypothetical protein
MADDFSYWMDSDDDFDGFDDGGDGGDQDDDLDQDDPDQDDGDPDDQGDDDQGDDGDSSDGDENLDDTFASEDDLPPVDDDVFQTASDFPNAEASDFEDDAGDWTGADYQQSAENLFGDHEFFGDTLIQQKTDEGFQSYVDENFNRAFDQIAPGSADTVHLFERDGKLFAFGFLSQMALQLLMARYTGIDMSNVEVAVPEKGDSAPPQPLPPAFANIAEQDAVDLRRYCTPIGDQAQTGRCSAFAWTHALEMSRNIQEQGSQEQGSREQGSQQNPKQQNSTRLSPNFTMLEFQEMQGDAQSYQYAYSGGDGTISGPDPGRVLVEYGTCRQDLWPDNRDRPVADQRQLESDAQRYRMEAAPLPIALEDVRKVLSAGCPVHVSMNTGKSFSNVGRDGLFNAAEAAWGRHGRHAMLIVGYTGNFFIVKNSWGTDWGDGGYCYIPKKVLADSDAEFIAVLIARPSQ